ncbi:hypothetical protein [Brevibacillus migulae]|uniref:hypothetical protein n=1 Tax=Brevibacillus migulae TaxID=1644114 RepID=UPI00106E6C60|nr:hypothetical protein [Brevibacillus migulae]
MPSFFSIIFFVLSLAFLFWIVTKREGRISAILQVLPLIFFAVSLEIGTKMLFYMAATVWGITTALLLINDKKRKNNL